MEYHASHRVLLSEFNEFHISATSALCIFNFSLDNTTIKSHGKIFNVAVSEMFSNQCKNSKFYFNASQKIAFKKKLWHNFRTDPWVDILLWNHRFDLATSTEVYWIANGFFIFFFHETVAVSSWRLKLSPNPFVTGKKFQIIGWLSRANTIQNTTSIRCILTCEYHHRF